MAYVKEIEIVDLNSGVNHLRQLFSNLKFDAEHEAIYGMGRFYTAEECNNLAMKYDEGFEKCEKFLDEELCQYCFVQSLINLNLGGYLNRIKQFLRPDLASKIIASDDDDDDSDSDSGEDVLN